MLIVVCNRRSVLESVNPMVRPPKTRLVPRPTVTRMLCSTTTSWGRLSVRCLFSPVIDIYSILAVLWVFSGRYSGVQGPFEPGMDVGYPDHGSRRSLSLALRPPGHVASAYNPELAAWSPLTLVASLPCDRNSFCGLRTSRRTRLGQT